MRSLGVVERTNALTGVVADSLAKKECIYIVVEEILSTIRADPYTYVC